MTEPEAGQRAMRIAFWIAAAGFLAACLDLIRGTKGLVDGLFRLALPAGIMLLASAIVFTRSQSRSWYALIYASGVLSVVVLGHSIARFLS